MQTFKLVLENWEGNCKRVTVQASSEMEAWGMAPKNWTVVEVLPV